MAKDTYHEEVKEALIKDGWTITDDPLVLLPKAEGCLETDLGAEKLIGAEKGLTKIAVEVKSFVKPSLINEFHKAMGQYLLYVPAIELKQMDRDMYLAMPENIYNQLIKKKVIQLAIEKYHIKIVLYNPKTATIKSWKK